VPKFAARGGTSFAAAFRLLRHEVPQDLAQLRSDNYRVHRPAVFFVTDGVPTDVPTELDSAFAELTSPAFKERPNILLFGVGEATKEALDPWVYPKTGNRRMRSYVARDGMSPKTAISEIAELLVSSIVASAHSVADASAEGGFIPPDDEDLDDWI